MSERIWRHEEAFDPRFWSGKRVFLTGHTGFKGAWLALWLARMGAQVHGYALDPLPGSVFELAGVADTLASDTRADLADEKALFRAVELARPDVALHLAAQPLVLLSLREPLATFETNVMGTLRVLEALRAHPCARAALVVTSDKVYENDETGRPYLEGDRLGGKDPYSASKACAEIALASWRWSRADRAAPGGQPLRLGSARAGNVIGGGDASADRLLPDIARAFRRGEAASIRNPASLRPWQHALEPLGGYLLLARALLEGDPRAESPFNFGPDAARAADVGQVARWAAEAWGEGAKLDLGPGEAGSKEAKLLQVDSAKARSALGWRALWSPQEAVRLTLEWEKIAFSQARDGVEPARARLALRGLCERQIAQCEQLARRAA
jgi:CDP-glucose 4,6-dehydratase